MHDDVNFERKKKNKKKKKKKKKNKVEKTNFILPGLDADIFLNLEWFNSSSLSLFCIHSYFYYVGLATISDNWYTN